MKDRVSRSPGQYKAVINGVESVITLTRDDQPEVEGTPYNKESVLPDDVANDLCPGIDDPTPADAFRKIKEGLDRLTITEDESELQKPLSVASGGTGATDADAARANLGAAPTSHNHSASNITSGTLAIARGGTGATSASAARDKLGIGCTRVWDGTLDAAGEKAKFTHTGEYSHFIIVGKPSSTYNSTLVIPAVFLGNGTKIQFQLTDESYYITLYVQWDTKATVTVEIKSMPNSSAEITKIYGII